MEKVIVVIGPTGSGKTDFALDLARRDPEKYELINTDSMQVYRELKVGNNKGELIALGEGFAYPELPTVPIWLVNLISVAEEFSVEQFQRLARARITDMQKRGKTPILVGGSGLYTLSVIADYDFSVSPEAQAELLKRKLELGNDVAELQQKLSAMQFDLTKLNNSDLHNPRRLQNILLKLESGETAEFSLELNPPPPIYEVELHRLEVDLTSLKLKLTERVEDMFARGLAEEAWFLHNQELTNKLSSSVANAAGYRQLLQFFHHHSVGEAKSDGALIEQIATSHHQLARKQLTWNKKYFAQFASRN